MTNKSQRADRLVAGVGHWVERLKPFILIKCERTPFWLSDCSRSIGHVSVSDEGNEHHESNREASEEEQESRAGEKARTQEPAHVGAQLDGEVVLSTDSAQKLIQSSDLALR